MLQTGLVLVCGSRAHLQTQSVAQRSYFRTLLMYGFHSCVLLLGGERSVKETQCGFKLMTRAAARVLFTNLHVERWSVPSISYAYFYRYRYTRTYTCTGSLAPIRNRV